MSSSECMDVSLCKELEDSVGKITTSGEPQLDPTCMKSIKRICKISNEYINYAYHLIIHQLEEEHAEVRFSAFTIMDELFRRSHVFRETVLAEFQYLLELTIETDPDYPLPPPKAAAKKLKCKALQCIQEWHVTYGTAYKQLNLGYRFLKECKKVDFTDVESRSVVERQRIDEQAARREAVLQRKVQECLQEISEKQVEIQNVLVEVQNAYDLILQSVGNIFTARDFEPSSSQSVQNVNNEPKIKVEPQDTDVDDQTAKDEDVTNVQLQTDERCVTSTEEKCEDVSSSVTNKDEINLRQHGLGSYKYSIDVNLKSAKTVLNDDNSAVIASLRDLIKVVKTKYIPTVEKWVQVLTKAGGPKDQLLKCIDIKHALNVAFEKYQKLNIENACFASATNKDDSSDDDDFEEVAEKVGFEMTAISSPIVPGSSSSGTSSSFTNITPRHFEDQDPTSLTSNVNAWMKRLQRKTQSFSSGECSTLDLSNRPSTSATSTMPHGSKKRLLSHVPKLRFDVDLLRWDEELTASPIIKTDALHRFWQPKDVEVTEATKEQMASLRMRKIDFSGDFEPVKWQCRAPLSSGKLCPRYDRFKCPFHGKVIARDTFGNPTNPDDIAQLKLEEEKKNKDKPPEWQDPVFLKELEAVTGMDLTVGKKKSRKRNPGLTSVKPASTSRTRLESKVLNRSSVKRVASTLDNLDYNKNRDKFGDQYNYTYNS